jgi:hypothetical protein
MKFSKKGGEKKRLSINDFKVKNLSVTTDKALSQIVGGALTNCHPKVA